MNQSAPENFVRPVSLEALDEGVLARLVAALPDRHHLDGAYELWRLPVLGFRLPPAVAKYPKLGADKDIALPPICQSHRVRATVYGSS